MLLQIAKPNQRNTIDPNLGSFFLSADLACGMVDCGTKEARPAEVRQFSNDQRRRRGTSPHRCLPEEALLNLPILHH